MKLMVSTQDIVSATDISKRFAEYRKQVKETSRDAIIFKNNQPDLALVDINNYEDMVHAKSAVDKLCQIAEDRLSKQEIKTISLDELLSIIDIS